MATMQERNLEHVPGSCIIWYREIGHGLVPISDEQKILFDNLGVEFADFPKHRSQIKKDVDIQ